MKKQLTLTLFSLIFLFSLNTSYASFPVKKVVQVDNIENISQSIDDVKISDTTYVVNTTDGYGGKSQLVALLLAFFLGLAGIHRFYLGYTWQGVVQLLTGGGFVIWAFIDLIRIITGDLQPKNGSYETRL